MNTQNRYENFKEHYVEELKSSLPPHLEFLDFKEIDFCIINDTEEGTDILYILADNCQFPFILHTLYEMYQEEGAVKVQEEIVERIRYEDFKTMLVYELELLFSQHFEKTYVSIFNEQGYFFNVEEPTLFLKSGEFLEIVVSNDGLDYKLMVGIDVFYDFCNAGGDIKDASNQILDCINQSQPVVYL